MELFAPYFNLSFYIKYTNRSTPHNIYIYIYIYIYLKKNNETGHIGL